MALFEEKVVILIASFVASDEPIFHSFRLRDQYFFYRMERGGGEGLDRDFRTGSHGLQRELGGESVVVNRV